MRRAASVDRNQPAIVDVFRRMGASVEMLHGVGKGCPDLLVGILGFNWIVEVKDGTRKPSERRLNDMQQDWHEAWNGQVTVIETTDDAAAFINDARRFAMAASKIAFNQGETP
jgi:hypothetical protein